jgi:hypothetical protein
MILQTARNYLAPYVENGRCTDTNVVRTVINEAQRRLYSMGNFLGLVKRWGVTVDSNGEFSIPVGCDVVMRIAELPLSLPSSINGQVIASDAYAFVFDSASLLRFTMISPTRFRVIGPYPKAVDVMGKVEYSDANSNIDALVVDDKDALKLMVLGLWRENNNAPELANELIGKARAHLEEKTRSAVETAKGAMYQSMLATCAPSTRGYHRAKAALAMSGGERTEDALIADLLDDAESRLIARTQIWESYLCKAVGGYFSVPRELESILFVDINNCPTRINSQSFEFLEAGLGYREAEFTCPGSPQVTYRGEFALQADMPKESKLTIFTEGTFRGIGVTIEGRAKSGNFLTEVVTVNGGAITTTVHTYADVTSITALPRDGAISFLVDDTEVARLDSYEQDTKRARYSIPSSGNCDTKILRVIGRPRWAPKVRDEQRMQITDAQATSLAAAAIQLERVGKLDESEKLEAKALRLLEEGALNRNAGHSFKINHSNTGTSMRRVIGRR